MNKSDLNQPATPVYRGVIAPLIRVLSRLKSGVAEGIDAHHQRAVSLRVYHAERLDGASAANPRSRCAETGGK